MSIAAYLEKASAASITAFAFFLPGSIAISNLAWLSGLGFSFFARLTGRNLNQYRPTGLELPFAAFLLVSFLSSISSVDPGRSLSKLWSEILILVFVLASQAQSKEQANRNFGILTFSLTIAGLWGVLQFALGVNWISSQDVVQSAGWFSSLPEGFRELLLLWNGRAVGFYNHPLTYAEVLLVGWPLTVAMWMHGPVERRSRFAFSAVAIVAGIAFSGSRGVWLALVLSIFLWFALTREKKLLGVLLAVAAIWLGAYLASPFLRQRTAGLPGGRIDDSNLVRLGLWNQSVKLIREDPFFGAGMGNIRIKPEELRWGGSRPDMVWTEVHNIFFQMAVERGLLGLGTFLWLLAAMGRSLWALAHSEGPPWTRGLFFGWVGLVLAGATESWTHDSEVVLVLYFLLGSGFVFLRREETLRAPR